LSKSSAPGVGIVDPFGPRPAELPTRQYRRFGQDNRRCDHWRNWRLRPNPSRPERM